jgi:hypothetical protein
LYRTSSARISLVACLRPRPFKAEVSTNENAVEINDDSALDGPCIRPRRALAWKL